MRFIWHRCFQSFYRKIIPAWCDRTDTPFPINLSNATMFADKLMEAKSSPFFREKAPYRPQNTSDDEIYAETEQLRSQGILLFSVYKDSYIKTKRTGTIIFLKFQVNIFSYTSFDIKFVSLTNIQLNVSNLSM